MTIELPPAGFPMLTRVISNALFPPAPQEEGGPVVWVLSKPHPLVSSAVVVRMFVNSGGVEIYSRDGTSGKGIRNLVPMSQVLLVEEVMPMDIFAEEIASAEAGEDDEDDDDPETEEDDGGGDDTSETSAPTPVNGQVASS